MLNLNDCVLCIFEESVESEDESGDEESQNQSQDNKVFKRFKF